MTFFLHQDFRRLPYSRMNTASSSKSEKCSQSPLETYLKEISETPILTRDQEQQIAAKIAEGCLESRDWLVRANLRLVVHIARGYTGRGLPLQDLIEEGNLGLIRSVEAYDGHFGTRFSTYASYWIKQTIKRALVNQGSEIRIPAYMAELMGKYKTVSNALESENRRLSTFEEVIQVMGIPKSRAEILKGALALKTPASISGGSSVQRNFGKMKKCTMKITYSSGIVLRHTSI